MRNVALAVIGAVIIGAVISYNYSIEQTKQKGLVFGKELESIQDDVKAIQAEFYSEKTKMEEGDKSREQLLEFYDMHIERFKTTIEKYDSLDAPEIFEGSVVLLKMSSQSQLDSDAEYIKWIKHGDEASKIRSDTLLQDALNYELRGLVEFYSAKTGTKSYDDTDEKFVKPRNDIAQKANQVAEHMIKECNEKYGAGKSDKDDSGSIIYDASNPEWSLCIEEAEKWRESHLP